MIPVELVVAAEEDMEEMVGLVILRFQEILDLHTLKPVAAEEDMEEMEEIQDFLEQMMVIKMLVRIYIILILLVAAEVVDIAEGEE